MKAQFKGADAKNNPNGKKEQFTFPWSKANKEYRLYTREKTFYDDMKVLSEHGLIDLIENNKNLRQPNVYAFSSRWKDWKNTCVKK